MRNPLVIERQNATARADQDVSELNAKDPDESGYFRTLEEIVDRIYPQPPE